MSESRWAIWSPRWPWLLILAGFTLTLYALHLGRVRWEREAYRESLETISYEDYPRIHHDASRVQDLAAAGNLREADALVQSIFARPNLSDLDHRAATVLSVRIRAQRGRTSEEDLTSLMVLEKNVHVWELAFRQRVLLRQTQGDIAGAIDLMEAAANGQLRHPEYDRIPFPYFKNGAAQWLAEHYLAAGDGPRAYAWARRFKYDFAIDFKGICGMAYSGERSHREELMDSTARLAGLTYTKEANDRWTYNRRIYGPFWTEIASAAISGLLLAFSGLCVLTRRVGRWPGRVADWRIFWRRRGGVAQVLMVTLLLAGAAPQLWLALEAGFPPRPGPAFWMTVLSPAFLLPLIALFGCFLAKPYSSLIGRGANRTAGIVTGRSATSAAALNGKSKKKQGASAAVRQQGPPSAM